MTGPLQVEVDGRTTVLEPGTVALVGRLSSAAVAVDDDAVSRRHAELRCRDGVWTLEDLGSANGTFRDGLQVRLVQVDGDTEVRLGGPDGVALRLVPAAVPNATPKTAAPDRTPAPETTSPPVRPGTGSATTEPSGGLVHRATVYGTGDTAPVPVATPESLGPALRVHPVGTGVVRVGRAGDNDIVLHDLEASRHHAELRVAADGSCDVRDLGSHNGTYVDGRRVERATAAPGEAVGIGSRLLVVTPEGVEEHSVEEHLPLAALGLTTVTDDGTRLLDDITFSLEESSLMAVLGPSGAGKSTLLGALTGLRPATSGRVLCGGEDLYEQFDRLSRRIGYVPQDDLVQPELTVEQSISYAAKLRFPPDVSDSERDERVAEVMDELGLTHRAHVRVGSLSGGQRKRVSIALELLTKPSVLFLDEPTSGLDPGYERSVMLVLRRLADSGRTVVLVTHSVESLHLCDRILCLAPGGRTAWFGPPEETAAYFGLGTYQEIFQVLDTLGTRDHAAASGAERAVDPEEWKARYEASSAHRRYVVRPLAAVALEGAPAAKGARARRSAGGWFRQFATLTSRYFRIILADRRTLMILAVTAPVLGFVLLLRLPPDQLSDPGGQVVLFSQAPLVVFIVVIGITQVATSTSIREIVKERAILEREHTVGLSVSAYVASKMAVLGTLAVVQAVVIVGIATLRQGGPGPGVVLGSGRLEMILIGSLVALGAMALGLLVSALVTSPDRVALILPAVLGFHLIVTSGEVMPAAPKVPVIQQARYLSTARWGYTAMASTTDVERLALVNRAYSRVPDLTAADLEGIHSRADVEALAPAAPEIAHTRRAWLESVAALCGLTAAFVLATVVVLRRQRSR